MNTKAFLVDYALPSLAALGAGLLTFALTGGVEEFPDVHLQVNFKHAVDLVVSNILVNFHVE